MAFQVKIYFQLHSLNNQKIQKTKIANNKPYLNRGFEIIGVGQNYMGASHSDIPYTSYAKVNPNPKQLQQEKRHKNMNSYKQKHPNCTLRTSFPEFRTMGSSASCCREIGQTKNRSTSCGCWILRRKCGSGIVDLSIRNFRSIRSRRRWREALPWVQRSPRSCCGCEGSPCRTSLTRSTLKSEIK